MDNPGFYIVTFLVILTYSLKPLGKILHFIIK